MRTLQSLVHCVIIFGRTSIDISTNIHFVCLYTSFSYAIYSKQARDLCTCLQLLHARICNMQAPFFSCNLRPAESSWPVNIHTSCRKIWGSSPFPTLTDVTRVFTQSLQTNAGRLSQTRRRQLFFINLSIHPSIRRNINYAVKKQH